VRPQNQRVITAAASGFGLGAFVAAQVGPIWLLCARSAIRHGARSGLAIGAGAAVVDTVYATLGVAGATQLVRIDPIRVTLGVAGAAFLLWLGGRTLWQAARVRVGGEGDADVVPPRAAFRTALAATASNPMTIASWAAIFSAASVGRLTDAGTGAAAMVAGIALGSFTWFAVLSTGAAQLGRRLSDRHLRLVDAASGLGIAVFGGVLLTRTLRAE